MALSPLAETIFIKTSEAHGSYSDKELAEFEVQNEPISRSILEIIESVRSGALAYLNEVHKEAVETTSHRMRMLTQFADHLLPGNPDFWNDLANS